MAIMHNGKAADSIFHDGKRIGAIYQGGKLVYQGRYIQKFTGRIWTGEGAAGTTGAGNEPYNISSADGEWGITVYNSTSTESRRKQKWYHGAQALRAFLYRYRGKECTITFRYLNSNITTIKQGVIVPSGFEGIETPIFISSGTLFDGLGDAVNVSVSITSGPSRTFYFPDQGYYYSTNYQTPKISYKLPKARKTHHTSTRLVIKYQSGAVHAFNFTTDTGSEVDRLYTRLKEVKGNTVDVEIEYLKP